jgi:hypothetical protein
MRLLDWEQRLHDLVSERLLQPYDPSRHDCLMWPADAVKAVTGKDFGKGHRGKYKSTATGYRHLQKMGFASPEALLNSKFDEKPVGYAGRGDLVLVEVEGQRIPAVVIGHHALAIFEAGEFEGLARIDRALWVKAWAVGEHHSGEMRCE